MKRQRCMSKGKSLRLSLQVLVRRWRAARITRPSERMVSRGAGKILLLSEALAATNTRPSVIKSVEAPANQEELKFFFLFK